MDVRLRVLVIACVVVMLEACAKPPPALTEIPPELDSPTVVQIARPKKFAGSAIPWRINVNGTDIGILSNGTRCAFETSDATVNLAIDAAVSGTVVLTSIGMLPVLGYGIVNFAMIAANRYEPTLPPVFRLESGERSYLRLEVGTGSVAIVTRLSHEVWTSEMVDLREVPCSL